MRLRAALGAAAAAALVLARAAAAQDFAPAAPAGPAPGAPALLERALPAAEDRLSAEATTTRWLGLPGLETRSLAALLPVRSLRVALGLSQTGDPELGWTAAALAAGGASDAAGFGLRLAARRDREGGPLLAGALGRGLGAEGGAGGWLAAAPGVVLWASAPQLWRSGEAPPLERPLELGATLGAGALSAWFAIGAPRAGDDGERTAGLRIAEGPLEVWAEGRDGPVRVALGVAAEAGPVRVAARIEGHPVLGETTRLSIALRGGAVRAAR